MKYLVIAILALIVLGELVIRASATKEPQKSETLPSNAQKLAQNRRIQNESRERYQAAIEKRMLEVEEAEKRWEEGRGKSQGKYNVIPDPALVAKERKEIRSQPLHEFMQPRRNLYEPTEYYTTPHCRIKVRKGYRVAIRIFERCNNTCADKTPVWEGTLNEFEESPRIDVLLPGASRSYSFQTQVLPNAEVMTTYRAFCNRYPLWVPSISNKRFLLKDEETPYILGEDVLISQ